MADVIDAIIAEALGEGPEGMAAVAHVIATRAAQTGKTPDQIINEARQFSGVSNPGSSVAKSMNDPSVRAQASSIWEGVLSGEISNPFPNADYFHTPQVSPNWSNSFQRLGQLGNHIFYTSGTPEQKREAPTPMPPIMRSSSPAVAAIQDAAPAWDWSKYAVGGAAARSDSFSGLSDPFSQSLQRMLSDAPAEVRLGITSAYRSPETQARLWEEALNKYGSASEARKWVAPPGNSQHNHGNAVDLKYLSPAAQAWVHANAGNYGLAFPLGNEPWHIELATARGRPPATMQAYAPSPAPPLMRNAAAPKGGSFFAPLSGLLANVQLPQVNMPEITPQMKQGALAPLLGTVAGRTALWNAIMPSNIGAAPNITQGFRPGGTLAMQVSQGGSVPVTLMRSDSAPSRAFDAAVHSNQNMDVYRANRDVVNGPINQGSIDRAMSEGKKLVKQV